MSTIAILLQSFLIVCLLVACDSEKADPLTEPSSVQTQQEEHSQQSNELINTQSTLISSQTQSPVHWQNWDKKLFENAKTEQKIIFAFIGSGTDSNTHTILEKINQSPASYNNLNNNNINTLIDSNCNPEIAYFAAQLSKLSNTTITQPMFICFTHEGTPISWGSIKHSSSTDIKSTIQRITQMINQLWRDDPQYVIQNSRTYFEKYNKAISRTLNTSVEHSSHRITAKNRRLASLFDPVSNNIDNIGKYDTIKYINALTMASKNRSIPKNQRSYFGGIARVTAQEILIQKLIDPLDNGVWDGKQNTTHALPTFSKSLSTQIQALDTLFKLYQHTEDTLYLTTAEKIHSFIETQFKQPNGNYSEGLPLYEPTSPTDPNLVTLEQLEEILNEQEIRICKLAFGIRGLGNIPSIDDPSRLHFRKNSLNWKMSKAELAQKTDLPSSEVDTIIDSLTTKLLQARQQHSLPTLRENLNTARSIASYSSAMSSAYRSTSSPTYLAQAKSLFDSLEARFTHANGTLSETKYGDTLSSTPASAQTLALYCFAALDLHDATQNSQYLEKAVTINQQLLARFYLNEEKTIIEQDYSSYPTNYKITTLLNLTSARHQSSIALTWSNISRILLHKNDEQLKTYQVSLGSLLNSRLNNSSSSTIDYISHHSHIHQPLVHIDQSTHPDLVAAARLSPCHIIMLPKKENASETDQNLLHSIAKVLYENKTIGTTGNPSELTALLK